MRKPAVAGSFYPTEGLSEIISQFFDEVKAGKVENGMIVPHAGYIYSGKTASVGYKSMLELLKKKKDIKNIIILGPSHRVGFDGILCDKNESWKTPLGEIKLMKFPEIKDNEEAHAKEHSIEVQVPFIQFVADELGRKLTITPLLVGELTNIEAKRYAEAFSKIENCFFVVSSDLSHYLNFAYAQKVDKETINKIINYDSEKLEACGRNPLRIIIEMAKLKKWEFKLLDYSTSADASGDKGAVVGYAAIGF
jgi:AmmeMemoRadiSam system protein B